MSNFHKMTKLLEEEDILNVLDTLHLDEYVVDEGINKIISKTNVSRRQLNTLLIFIKYKLMLCLQEDEDCGNCDVGDYIVQQLLQMPDNYHENFELLLKMLSYSLMLNTRTMSKSVEHISQQLISEVITFQKAANEEEVSKCIVYLMICDRLFNTCIENGVKLNSRFLKFGFKELIDIGEKRIQKHIFSQTIPNMINCCEDVTFLNFIWNKVSENLTADNVSLLCILSDFYFPSYLQIDSLYVIKSFIVKHTSFWELIECGLARNDPTLRKYCIYLAKRGIDFILQNDLKINLKSTKGIIYIIYDDENKSTFEETWKSFFIVMESLEEKQAHLVTAALNLFHKLDDLHPVWYNTILRRALMHETDSVSRHALDISFNKSDNRQYLMTFPFNALVCALNKTNIYEDFFNSELNSLYGLVKGFLKTNEALASFLNCSSFRNFSLIPRYYVSYILSTSDPIDSIVFNDIQLYIDLYFNQNSPSNNPFLECAIQSNILNFAMKNLRTLPYCIDLYKLISRFSEHVLYRNSDAWNKLKAIVTELHDKESENANGAESEKESLEKLTFQDPKGFARLILLMYDTSILGQDVVVAFFNMKLVQLEEADKRSYAKNDEFDHIYFIINTFISNVDHQEELYQKLTVSFSNQCDSVTNYILTRLQNISQIDEFDFVNECVKGLNDLLVCKDIGRFLYVNMQSVIYKTVEILKCPKSHLIQKYFGLRILLATLDFVENNSSLQTSDKRTIFMNCFEVFGSDLFFLSMNKNEKKSHSKGRIMSALNETCCEMYYLYYNYIDNWTMEIVQSIYENVLEFLEKGGNNCIASTIKLSRILIERVIKQKRWDSVKLLIECIWREVYEVRKNEQFRKSLKAFVGLLFNKEIYKCKNMHHILIIFGEKLLECGDMAPYTVYLMMQEIKKLSGEDLRPLFPLISKALLFGNVPRKDQRIELEVCNHALSQYPNLKFNEYSLNLNEEIKVSTLEILIKQNKDFHNILVEDFRERASVLLKNKQRYHGNSMTHRIILRIFQALILSWKSTLINKTTIETINWCVNLLSNQPHHVSIRILAEWYISLHLIFIDKPLKDCIEDFGLSQLPTLSYFTIIYHVIRHQILLAQDKISYQYKVEIENVENYRCSNSIGQDIVWKNLDFVFETLMPFTMGQLFNIRLHSQYMICKLYELIETGDRKEKYSILYKTIESNFKMNAEEKNLQAIQKDFFMNNFDILYHLNAANVYNRIPVLVGITRDESISEKYGKYLDDIGSTILFENNNFDDSVNVKNNILAVADSVKDNADGDNVDEVMNIQKKFIPWKNMLIDMDFSMEKKNVTNRSGLIIVASLVDKLPNLGGLSRTCEVFGVKQFVMSSKKHMSDKSFQSLSVSSENWVDVSEVQPGSDLKKYLIGMKTKGYKIVGAEQSSSSVALNKFSFPRNMILLLGHEKQGIPPDLMSILDSCVEIPQRGMVRSLNVHVTASIFIWEYCKQNNILGEI